VPQPIVDYFRRNVGRLFLVAAGSFLSHIVNPQLVTSLRA